MEILLSFGPRFGLGAGKQTHFQEGTYDQIFSHLASTPEGEWISEPQALKLQDLLKLNPQRGDYLCKQARVPLKPIEEVDIWNTAKLVTKKFLKANRSVYVMNVDKGNITVLITKENVQDK